ncbi:HNH endonuclease [Streptococcus oralis]|nr:HNH endonuclease [Streptococcus oralis]MBZ2097164.1 HNH endonuclease [Streptococcus oralis]MBZ2102684.1 HNH endonuclease [Streptococcus oralis]
MTVNKLDFIIGLILYQDGKTLQEVPTKIHTQFTHRGGFSIIKKGKQ